MTSVAQDPAATVPSAAEAQNDAWARDPDARVSGVLTPTAETARVDDGFRVAGRWYYNSGSWHAGWAVLGISITDGDGAVVDQGLALIPRDDLGFAIRPWPPGTPSPSPSSTTRSTARPGSAVTTRSLR